ncbi:MAG: hypothetical protein KDG89_05425, partial [Geminicoccaceae bacterium]|nr:hypothetical protein [Geminicoccaceae bacterium]
ASGREACSNLVDRGETAKALAVHDHGLAPTGRSVTLSLCDAASLLWRVWLEDGDAACATAERFAVLAERFEKPALTPCHVFNAVLAFAGAGRNDAAEAQVARLAALAAGEGDHALMLRRLGLPAARACRAFAQGDAVKAVAFLETVMPHLALMTGSHAQQDVMRMTLIEAWLRAGERGKAKAALEARLAAKPGSRRIEADLARAA